MNKRTFLSSQISICLPLLLLVAVGSALSGQIRSIDGTGNNLTNNDWGAVDTRLLRKSPNAYADGIGSMIGSIDRENPRVISNAVVAQSGSMPNSSGLTNFVWQWGQFIDHDFSLTEGDMLNGMAPISVPTGDILGPAPIPFNRSNFDPSSGTSTTNPREQINQITAYIDASNVYGSDAMRASWLRSNTGGRLKMSAGDLLPYNDGTIGNAEQGELPGNSTDLFVAGDIRANEQVGLTAMHTLFAREHNRLADLLQGQLPSASDEQIYQTARRIVGAELQSITYNEFLPAVLGAAQMPTYAGYDATVDASIATEFSTAFYRFGHTMLPADLTLMDSSGTVTETLALRDAFFDLTIFDDPQNVDRVLGGLVAPAQEIDGHLVDDVRSFLFGPAGAGGMDLAALNIQRGRDHGLPDYNALREAYGLAAKEKFLTDGMLADGVTPNGVTSDADVAANLAAVYASVDDIDPWLGGLVEDPMDGSPLSELMVTALVDQFARARDGDRFFYLNDSQLLAPEVQAVIDIGSISLRDVIELNTTARFSVDNIFVIPESSAGVTGLLGALGLMLVIRRRN